MGYQALASSGAVAAASYHRYLTSRSRGRLCWGPLLEELTDGKGCEVWCSLFLSALEQAVVGL